MASRADAWLRIRATTLGSSCSIFGQLPIRLICLLNIRRISRIAPHLFFVRFALALVHAVCAIVIRQASVVSTPVAHGVVQFFWFVPAAIPMAWAADGAGVYWVINHRHVSPQSLSIDHVYVVRCRRSFYISIQHTKGVNKTHILLAVARTGRMPALHSTQL